MTFDRIPALAGIARLYVYIYIYVTGVFTTRSPDSLGRGERVYTRWCATGRQNKLAERRGCERDGPSSARRSSSSRSAAVPPIRVTRGVPCAQPRENSARVSHAAARRPTSSSLSRCDASRRTASPRIAIELARESTRWRWSEEVARRWLFLFYFFYFFFEIDSCQIPRDGATEIERDAEGSEKREENRCGIYREILSAGVTNRRAVLIGLN